MQRTRRLLVAGLVAVAILSAVATLDPVRGALHYLWAKARGGYTVAERLEQFGHRVEKRLKPVFDAASVKYPPRDLAFVAFKDSKILELYAKDAERSWRFIRVYRILAARTACRSS